MLSQNFDIKLVGFLALLTFVFFLLLKTAKSRLNSPSTLIRLFIYLFCSLVVDSLLSKAQKQVIEVLQVREFNKQLKVCMFYSLGVQLKRLKGY